MKSHEIKAIKATDISSTEWLKEIAYQLALLNEPRPVGRPKKDKDAHRA